MVANTIYIEQQPKANSFTVAIQISVNTHNYTGMNSFSYALVKIANWAPPWRFIALTEKYNCQFHTQIQHPRNGYIPLHRPFDKIKNSWAYGSQTQCMLMDSDLGAILDLIIITHGINKVLNFLFNTSSFVVRFLHRQYGYQCIWPSLSVVEQS